MKDFTFCPFCAEPLERGQEEGHERLKCRRCGFIHYKNPVPAVGVIVMDERGVLLVRRRYDPYSGMWVIPSGFIENGEDVRTTGVREVQEETGLVVEIDSLHVIESCFDDPRGNSILVLYRGRITGGELSAGDDAAEVGFFPLDKLPPIAFEAHRKTLGALARSIRKSSR